MKACPRPSGTRNHAGGTLSFRYEVTQKDSKSSSNWYDESSRRDYVPQYEVMQGELVHARQVRGINKADFVHPVRSRAIGGHVIVPLVRGIKHAGLLSSDTKSRERRACPRPSGMRNQAGRTSSVRYEVMRKEGLSPSVWYKEIEQAALPPSSMKSHERKTCPHLFGMRNHVSGTSSVRYEVVRKESLSTFVQYEESSKRNFFRPVQSSEKGELVLVCSEEGIKQAGLRLPGTKSRKRKPCPRPFGMWNKAGRTSYVCNEVVRMEGLSSSL